VPKIAFPLDVDLLLLLNMYPDLPRRLLGRLHRKRTRPVLKLHLSTPHDVCSVITHHVRCADRGISLPILLDVIVVLAHRPNVLDDRIVDIVPLASFTQERYESVGSEVIRRRELVPASTGDHDPVGVRHPRPVAREVKLRQVSLIQAKWGRRSQ
jgi:hypothetical protein